MKVEKIYFDLDGVMADFARGVTELCGIEYLTEEKADAFENYDDYMWEHIRMTERFYDRLELIEGAKELFDTIYALYGDRCEILTGIPKESRNIPDAGECKLSWVKRMLSEDIKVNIVFKDQKKDYCKGPEWILIDDYISNIEAWRSNGGTGIHFKSAQQGIEELKSLNVV